MVDSHDAETYSAKDSRLIWIDCEMTGLDIFGGDELVEVSVVPTDFDLNVLDEGVDYVIKPSEKAVNHMNDFVRQMHTRSGLINEWENGLSCEPSRKSPNTCCASRRKACARCWPATPSAPIRSSSTITCPEPHEPPALPQRGCEHIQGARPPLVPGRVREPPAKRTVAIVLSQTSSKSLDELRYYRKAFMAPAPGPDDAASKAIAADIVATSILNK